MVHFISSAKYRTKLIWSFALIAIIPMILVIFLSYFISKRDVTQMSREYTATNMNVVCRQIDAVFMNAQSVCETIENNINMQEYIRKEFTDISERYSYDLKVSMELLNMYSTNKDLYGIYILGENGAEYKSNYCSFQNIDFSKLNWYKMLMNQNDCTWFVPHSGSFIVKTVKNNFISVGKAIRDKANGENRGIVMVDLLEEPLISLLDQYKNSENGFFAADEYQNIIFTSSFYDHQMKEQLHKIAEGEIKKAKNGIVKINNKSYLLSEQKFNNGLWKIYALISIDRMEASSSSQLFITIIILVSSILLMYLMIFWNSNTITRPISILSNGMQEIRKGNLNVQLKKESNDEMGQLIDNFNATVLTMQELNLKIYEEQENIRKAEFKALQAQINPHFLYNSLDSISWLLRLNKKEDAIKMVEALTKLFKVVLSKGKEYIPVADELRHAENYLLIQKIRYKNKFSYELEIDDSVRKYRTIKLLLQPLIENAIYHGIAEETEYEKIIIRAAEVEDGILFQVSDTGQGMTEENLRNLKESILNKVQDTNKSYGLHNIYERLQVYYTGKAEMTINSVWGKGTDVIIKIPGEPTH